MKQERGLPCNPDAERLVLGSILNDGTLFAEVAATLTRDDFSLDKNVRIWDRMADLASRGDHIDRITLCEELAKRSQLEAAGGFSYLASLDEGLPRLPNLDGYVKILRDKATLRRAILVCHETEERLMMAGPEALEEIQRAERILRDLSAPTELQKLKSPLEVITSAEGGYEGFLHPESKPRGIPTPWKKLNHFMTGGGMRPGQLWTLAALTSRGKSAMALQIAEHVASLSRGAVPVFAIEMSGEEVLARMACSRAMVDQTKWHAGYASKGDIDRIAHATAEITNWPLFIDDTTTASLSAIDSALRKLQAKHPLALVVIDYLQIMKAVGRFDSRVAEVSALARGCKLLAREYRVPVLLLSQFSRANKNEERPPQLSDLKESSEIEQASDGIIMLHSKSSDWMTDSDAVPVEVMIGKQRGGPTGHVPDGLVFHRRCVRFFEGWDEAAAVQA